MIFIALHPQEIIVDLGSMVRKMLIQFYQTTCVNPSKIIFYRDGVREGQLQQVGRGGEVDKVDTLQRVLSQTM